MADLVVDEAALTGPDGPLELHIIEPHTTESLLPFTAALLPVKPLRGNTTYELDATVTWPHGTRRVRSTFQTDRWL